MVRTKTENENEKVSLFKKVLSRHKRQAKEPNRIDDLLGVGEDGDGIIDVARIHRNRVRNRNEISTLPSGNNDGDDTANGDNFVFGEDLVTITESVLPDIIQNGEKNYTGRRCSCFAFREFPGVYLYPKALDKELQWRLAYEAVNEYCELGPTTSNDATYASGNGVDDVNGNGNGESQNINSSHRTNIDLLPPKKHERVNQLNDEMEIMWNLWKRDQVLSKGDDNNHLSNRPPPEKKPKRDAHKAKIKTNNMNYYRRFSKLSWATMGFHYDWTERCYHPQKKSKMPDLVAKLSTIFATANPTSPGQLGSENSTKQHTQPRTFTPSASIVNYYTTKSTMGGHRDDLEDQDAMDKPIVSISLGLPGIFVLGGPIRDECECEYEYECNGGSNRNNANANANANENEHQHNSNDVKVLPHPVRTLVLRPGDVLIMGGASRLNYHSMVRVLPHEAAMEYDRRTGHNNNNISTTITESGFETKGDDSNDRSVSFANLSTKDLCLNDDDETEVSRSSSMWTNPPGGERDYLIEYLRHHRVNINVRQVYPDE